MQVLFSNSNAPPSAFPNSIQSCPLSHNRTLRHWPRKRTLPTDVSYSKIFLARKPGFNEAPSDPSPHPFFGYLTPYAAFLKLRDWPKLRRCGQKFVITAGSGAVLVLLMTRQRALKFCAQPGTARGDNLSKWRFMLQSNIQLIADFLLHTELVCTMGGHYMAQKADRGIESELASALTVGDTWGPYRTREEDSRLFLKCLGEH